MQWQHCGHAHTTVFSFFEHLKFLPKIKIKIKCFLKLSVFLLDLLAVEVRREAGTFKHLKKEYLLAARGKEKGRDTQAS